MALLTEINILSSKCIVFILICYFYARINYNINYHDLENTEIASEILLR